MFNNIINHIGNPVCIKYRYKGEEHIYSGILTNFYDYGDLKISINNKDSFYFCSSSMIIISIVDNEDNCLYRIEDLDDEFQYLYDKYKPYCSYYATNDKDELSKQGIKEINIDTLPEWIEFTNKYSNYTIIISIVIDMLQKLNAGMKPNQVELLTFAKDYRLWFDFNYNYNMQYLIDTYISKFIKDDYLQAQYVDYLNNLYEEKPKKLILELNGENPGAYQVNRFKKRS